MPFINRARVIVRLRSYWVDLILFIDNCLKNPADCGTKKQSDRPRKLSERDKRRIFRAASNPTKIYSSIKSELDLNFTPEAIRLAIANLTLVRRKMKRTSALTKERKRHRLEFARQNMHRNWSKLSLFGGFLGVEWWLFSLDYVLSKFCYRKEYLKTFIWRKMKKTLNEPKLFFYSIFVKQYCKINSHANRLCTFFFFRWKCFDNCPIFLDL
jgi:transposase-like protein